MHEALRFALGERYELHQMNLHVSPCGRLLLVSFDPRVASSLSCLDFFVSLPPLSHSARSFVARFLVVGLAGGLIGFFFPQGFLADGLTGAPLRGRPHCLSHGCTFIQVKASPLSALIPTV